MDGETEAQMHRKLRNFHKVTPFTNGQTWLPGPDATRGSYPLPEQRPAGRLGDVPAPHLRAPRRAAAQLQVPHSPAGTSVSRQTSPWSCSTEKQGASDRQSRWFKKVIRKLCLLFGFRGLSSFRFEQWVLGGASRLRFAAESWVCLAQRSDLRVSNSSLSIPKWALPQ